MKKEKSGKIQMQVAVIGTCEKSCPLYLREKITSAFEILVEEASHLFSFVLLSTCRRVELYFSSEDLTGAHVEIVSKLRKILKKPFEHTLYSLFEIECFFHLMKVTAGLDSSITGESEIQNQVKISYEKCKRDQYFPLPLHYIFQKSLKVGKNMRTSYEFFKRQNSFAHIILSQLKILSRKPFTEQKLLFIGNSQINRHMLPVFFAKNFKNITLSTKTKDLHLFSQQSNFDIKTYEILRKSSFFDAIICATKSSQYLIQFSSSIKAHQVLFDLSIPRNIDPKVKSIAPLLNIEELGALFEEKKRYFQKEIAECEKNVASLVERYTKFFFEKKQKRQNLQSSFSDRIVI